MAFQKILLKFIPIDFLFLLTILHNLTILFRDYSKKLWNFKKTYENNRMSFYYYLFFNKTNLPFFTVSIDKESIVNPL